MRQRMVFGIGLALLIPLFATALAFRVVHLENLPGVNGDEAWYGKQAARCVASRPFALRTPTGLPLNPFFSGLIALELLVFKPSIAVLRAPAAFCGIATVVLTYVLGARITDRTTALIASILLATAPIAIGYSRFGWDPSQIPLFGLVAIYFAFRGNTPGVVLSFLAGLLVHLTNAFLLPVLVLPYVARGLRSFAGDPAGRRWFLLKVGAATCAGVLAVFAYHRLCVHVDDSPWQFERADLIRLDSLLMFLTHYGRLVSGITVYEYIVGPVAPGVARLYDWIFWVVVLVALEFGTRRLVCDGQWERLGMIAGLVASALGLYVIGGPLMLRPHFERYGLFLFVPTVLSLACLLRALIPGRSEGWATVAGRLVLAGVVLVGGASLVGFKVHYFDVLRTTGGRSHVCFRTGATEPKRRLVSLVARDMARGHHATGRVVAEDWWLYSPMEYLATARGTIELVNFTPLASEHRTWSIDPVAELRRGSYVAGYIGGHVEGLVTTTFPPAMVRRWDVADYAGRKFLTLFRLERIE